MPSTRLENVIRHLIILTTVTPRGIEDDSNSLIHPYACGFWAILGFSTFSACREVLIPMVHFTTPSLL